MTKYAVFEKSGFPIAFYSSEIHGTMGEDASLVPTDAIEITDAQWQDFIDNQGYRKWLDGDVATYTPPVSPIKLPDLAPYQFRAMLKLSGKQEALYAFISALEDPAKTIAQSKLEYSLSFKRDNSLVLDAQHALGLTDKALDALWVQATEIR